MKKILVVLLALLCVGAAFAEGNPGVSVGAWGRSFLAVGSMGDQMALDTQASWWTDPRIGFTIASNNSANIGFQVDLNVDGWNVNTGDNQKIWAKLLDGMITVQIGHFFDDTLRGNAAFGMHNWVRFGAGYMQEDAIFPRVGFVTNNPADRSNFEVSVATSGFYGYVSFNNVYNTKAAQVDGIAQVMQYNGQYGAGYTIPDIGTIRAQYIGAGDSAADLSYINAAFKLTAVKGLTVDLGMFMFLDDAAGDITIPVFASYNMGTITINACAAVTLSDPDMQIEMGLGGDFDLGNGLGVNADFRLANDGTDNTIGFGAGLTKGLGNGLIGVGVEVAQGGFAGGWGVVDPTEYSFLIPVRLEYWF